MKFFKTTSLENTLRPPLLLLKENYIRIIMSLFQKPSLDANAIHPYIAVHPYIDL